MTSTGRTKIYAVVSKPGGIGLGFIKWFGRWRQYCFFPEPETVFNRGCMSDIQNVITDLMNERKVK